MAPILPPAGAFGKGAGASPTPATIRGVSDYTRCAMTASDSTFDAAARATLEACLEAAESTDAFDVEIEGGVLTIVAPTGETWVLNKHAPTRQLWLSSPVSGASHYARDDASGAWRDTRGGPPLDRRFAEELGRSAGRKVELPA
jgi:frataxin